MKNKKWSKLVQIEKNTEKGHTESTEIHRKNNFSHRKHGNTQKFFCAVEGVVFFHGKHRKKLRRREVRGELTVWGDSGERDDVRWGWWGRVFHDGGGIVAPALGMTVGIE